MPTTPPAPGRTRRNRGSDAVADRLVGAAISEFAAHGFEGASTRRIAEAADAHQSQIAYHFETKDELWRRCLEQLLAELDDHIAQRVPPDPEEPTAVLAATVRGLVHFAAARPELSRIMMHEATTAGPRLTWLVDTHLGRRQVALRAAWADLAAVGRVADIDVDLVYHTVIGAASLLYANAPEAELMGVTPRDPGLVDRHADALVAMLLRS